MNFQYLNLLAVFYDSETGSQKDRLPERTEHNNNWKLAKHLQTYMWKPNSNMELTKYD